jgi:hypothetical protein
MRDADKKERYKKSHTDSSAQLPLKNTNGIAERITRKKWSENELTDFFSFLFSLREAKKNLFLENSNVRLRLNQPLKWFRVKAIPVWLWRETQESHSGCSFLRLSLHLLESRFVWDQILSMVICLESEEERERERWEVNKESSEVTRQAMTSHHKSSKKSL